MALGGGTWLTQNKVLPGSYINFISAARASATLSDRGFAALPLAMNWGEEDKIITLELADLQKDSFNLLGYAYTDDNLRPLREIFKGAKTVYLYRINSGGNKASLTSGNLTATAKYGGTRGNDISIVIEENIDEVGAFDVKTYVDGKLVDSQTGKLVADLVANHFVVFSGNGALVVAQGSSLIGGSNGTVDGTAYSDFLDAVEAFNFNILVYDGTDDLMKSLFVEFTKRMRDDHGVKFQTVVHKFNTADFEGVISVENKILDAGLNEASLVYWVAGQEAGCPVNRSVTNKTYDGEFKVDVDYKQSALEAALKNGKFMFHKVGDKVNVLDDINTFVSFTVDKNEDFNNNQVIRVLDQIGNDIAVLFNTKFLGKVQNNDAGRIAFWNELVTYHREMQRIQAIENFEADDVVVEKGNDKKSVLVTDYVMPVSVMTKLYMTVIVE